MVFTLKMVLAVLAGKSLFCSLRSQTDVPSCWLHDDCHGSRLSIACDLTIGDAA